MQQGRRCWEKIALATRVVIVLGARVMILEEAMALVLPVGGIDL
jgi:hypothetical protein